MATFKIDGREIEIRDGASVLEHSLDAGIEIPHFCWHKTLGFDGNCRMCMCEVEGMPGVQIACGTQPSDGMEVSTQETSETAREAQEGVLEMLLINHPLDCTICDQAGECPLQENTHKYGPAASRFEESKLTKPKKEDWGEHIIFDAERCILCTRCTRFMSDVRDDDVIGISGMGDKSTLTLGAAGELKDDYQLNVVDLCPVGALTSKHTRFHERVWFMDFAETVCPGCSTGCSVTAGAFQGELRRMKPREVGLAGHGPVGPWMCDTGRLDIDRWNSADRLSEPTVGGEAVSWDDAVQAAADIASKPGAIGVATTMATCEELGAFAACFPSPEGPRTARSGATDKADGFLLTADRTMNARGADAAGIGPRVKAFGEGVETLFILGDDPVEVPDTVTSMVVMATAPTDLTRRAQVVLPWATPFEKTGHVENKDGVRQSLSMLLQPRHAGPAADVVLRRIAALVPQPEPEEAEA